MQLPILFHEGRTGKLFSWKVWTKDNVIFQEYGTVEGKKSTTKKAVKGKNIGKKNETTPADQAESEAKAMWQKKKDTKYSETKKAAKETVFLPMLAHDLKKSKKPLEFPVDVQPKLNGVRCMAFWMGNRVVLMSRGGKEYSVPHIVEALQVLLPKDYVADGELYIHGIPLQDIVHFIKNPEIEEHQQIEFRIFDGFYVDKTEVPWLQRNTDLQQALGDRPILGMKAAHVYIVPTYVVNSQEELFKKLQAFELDGYEGAIARVHNAIYELGHRSRGLWKLKNFIDDEFEIVGFGEASGNDKGTVVWECKTDKGATFTVRPKGTREMRAKWYSHGKDYIGKKLTVKFQEWTNDGLPEFPVGICIREDL